MSAADAGPGVELLPFRSAGAAAPIPDLQLAGWLQRRAERLWVRWRLRGPLEALRIAAPAAQPRRRDELWQSTCFELFLAVPGEAGYREFNLAPSGDWNVYQLDGYRQGLRPDPAWSALPAERRQAPGELTLTLETELPAELAAAPVLEAALTAVLEPRQGPCAFWALAHPGPEADFHRRDGFLLRL